MDGVDVLHAGMFEQMGAFRNRRSLEPAKGQAQMLRDGRPEHGVFFRAAAFW
ncbi:MAG: hypothetical protein ACYDEB_11445 [Dehalococcoidia bacterium]